MTSLADELAALGADVHPALERIAVPAYVLDSRGRLLYMNGAAIQRFGDRRGQQFRAVVAPDSARVVRHAFARKLVGTDLTAEYKLNVIDKAGHVIPAEVSSVALENHGVVVGVFGLVDIHRLEHAALKPVPELTPRQAEVLRHLTAGCTTAQMAERMGISPETVRNHVRGPLARLKVHSRLEAVVRAQELGLTA